MDFVLKKTRPSPLRRRTNHRPERGGVGGRERGREGVKEGREGGMEGGRKE